MSSSRVGAGPDARQTQADVELDMGKLFAALWRAKMWVVVPTLLALVGSVIFVNWVTPRYSAEARIVIENRETALTRPGGNQQQNETPQPLDQEAVQSQVQIIYSRDTARAVIRDLQLTRNAEFDPMVSGRGIIGTLLALTGIVRDVSQLTAEERALEAYYERLAAYPVERSRVIEIRFISRDPDVAARVANAIAERYIEQSTKAKLERDRRARVHVQRTIDELRQQVVQAENRVQEHRSRFDLLTGTSNQTLGVQTASELNTQISAAQTQRADAMARLNAIRDMLRSGRPVEASEVLSSPVIQRLSEQRAALRAEIAQQSTILLPGHPRMRELNAQVADNENQLRAQAERIARSLENDARIAGDRLGQLRRVLDEQKRLTSSQGDQEVQLRSLEREAKAQRDLLESWLGMYRESSARDSLDARAADARIVSQAVASNTPIWPKKLPTILITTLSAFLVMVVVLFTKELASGNAFVRHGSAAPVASGPRAEPWLPAPGGTPIGSGPGGGGGGKPRPEGARRAMDALAAAFAPRVAGAGGTRGAKRTVVTGLQASADGVGFALGLGRALSAQGRRVALIDLDPTVRGLGARAGLGEVAGIAEIVAGRIAIAEAVHRDQASRAHVVPFGAATLAEAELMSPRLATLLAALDAAYDHLLLVGAAVEESDAAVGFAQSADLVILVADAGTLPPIAEAARGALAMSGAGEVVVAELDALAETAASPAPSALDIGVTKAA